MQEKSPAWGEYDPAGHTAEGEAGVGIELREKGNSRGVGGLQDRLEADKYRGNRTRGAGTKAKGSKHLSRTPPPPPHAPSPFARPLTHQRRCTRSNWRYTRGSCRPSRGCTWRLPHSTRNPQRMAHTWSCWWRRTLCSQCPQDIVCTPLRLQRSTSPRHSRRRRRSDRQRIASLGLDKMTLGSTDCTWTR